MRTAKTTRRWWLACAAAVSLVAHGQQQEIHRALIERDQQSAEFAARLRGSDVRALENLHARQLSEALVPLSPDPAMALQLLPYQRHQMAQEGSQKSAEEQRHVLRFASPIFQEAPQAEARREPLPLPGGARSGVDPVAPEGLAR